MRRYTYIHTTKDGYQEVRSTLGKRIAVLFMAVTLALAFMAMIWWALSIAGDEKLPPCETEDSTNCYWDASERGNGLGNDFIVLD